MSTEMLIGGLPMFIKGIHYQTGEAIGISIENENISSIEKLTKGDISSKLPIIAPGLVDLQLNGYRGVDFNSPLFSKEDVYNVTSALWKEGVVSYYPTIITNEDSKIEEAIGTILESCEAYDLVNKSIEGIHLEGPFISPEDGPRGAHKKKYVQKPDWPLFQKWQHAAKGKIKILTLSPEWPGSLDFIKKCADSGVTVAIGHTAATPEQIKAAVSAGAKLSTHLGNGAHLMMQRHPNYIWEQLAQDNLWASCIADGFHLPPSVLKVIFKVKKEMAILVSDAVYLSGLPPGTYNTHIGGEVVLTSQGKLHLADNPNLLAGSVKMLKSGIENLVQEGICSFPDAWNAASILPALLMNLPIQKGLSIYSKADFVLIERQTNHWKVIQTVKHGKIVYQDESSIEN